MHVSTGPHDPHADCTDDNRDQTDPKVTRQGTFG